MTMMDCTDHPLAGNAEIPKDQQNVGVRNLAVGGFLAASLATAIGAGSIFDVDAPGRSRGDEVSLSQDELRKVAEMNVDDAEQILVEGDDALAQNAQVPLSTVPLERVGGFTLGMASSDAQSTAQKCLAQAVYYEAANEPLQGRRAVAQVVLNRMRHKAYPSSVCGVVYEGSARQTGCQFSFTCDGSLLRAPMVGPWKEAQKVAREALAGYVEKSVGTATHYHADYVLPKWAFNLGKITQLGRHIFYRFNGGWGRAGAFHGRYSGHERLPYINFAALRSRTDEQASQDFVPGLTVEPHIADRHAESDVGGRLDVTKEWRLTIPDPTEASSNYDQAVAATDRKARPARQVALVEDKLPAAVP